jgi:plastocyanin
MKRLMPFISTFLFGLSSLLPLSVHAATTNAFNAGDVVKASGPAVYYFASNGKRYVFPNEKTYFTWYTNFTGVKTISDRQLAAIPIGGNVTYRPGRKMVKITTDPRVYVVDEGGVLRHVKTEQVAETLYTKNWNDQIDDIPDAFFVNYRLGTAIEQASEFRAADIMARVTNISQDKQLIEGQIAVAISDVSTGFVPTSITVKRGTTVTWTNRDITPHTVTGSGWGSPTLAPDATYSYTFNSAGSFDYKCSIHPAMQGTINVVN